MLHRRSFLLSAGAGCISSFVAINSLDPRRLAAAGVEEYSADVVIIGGGLGGVAGALGALRGGATVILTEETHWIGGQLTSQMVPPDENKWIETGGGTRDYRRLRTNIRDAYRQRTDKPLTVAARAKPNLNPGNGWVSRLCCEPRMALNALEAMLQPFLATGRLILLRQWKANSVDVDKDQIRAVRGKDLRSGRDHVLSGRYVLDATEQGDLLPMGRIEHVTGFESRDETKEPHAPAKAQPQNIQSFTVCFALEFDPKNEHLINKPADYEFWRDYEPQLKPPYHGKLFSWVNPGAKGKFFGFDPATAKTEAGPNLWTYRRIIDASQFAPESYPGDVSIINWPHNDHYLGNLHAVPDDEATKSLAKARAQSLALVYWLQNDAPRADGGTGWKNLRLCPEQSGTADGLAMYPYIRESRRIKAEFTVTENHVLQDLRAKETGEAKEKVRAAEFKDTVGIGHYPMDLHPSTGGDGGMGWTTVPFQIPLGALIPVRVENLLAACKNLGVTHLANGCYRLHPVEWNIGESAGALAAFCVAKKATPKQVRGDEKLLGDFQTVLREAGVELTWPADARP